jgi:multiple sugar transport system permease protein
MKKMQSATVIFITGVMAVLFALPILVTITNSFMTGFEITNRYASNITPGNYFYRFEFLPRMNFVRMTLIPDWLSLGQFAALFRDVRYMDSLWNSVLITLPVVLGQIIVCVPAAYAFEYSKWRHKEKLFFVYLVVMLMPLPVILVPQFVIARFLGIDESVLAVILPAVFAPFGVFLLRQFLKNIPVEFIEAAKIDGASQLRILVSIITPLLKAAVTALALLVFIDYWNVVDQAIVFITNPAMMPLSVYLSRLAGNFQIIFAASFFYMLPALLVFLHGQEQLIDGMKMSGLR